MLLTGDQFVAAAEITQFMAERDMDIKGKWTIMITGSRPLEGISIVLLIELQCCRV
ncbi:hypothetical protein XNA1_2710008 [Xenorhabdus nematophila str. Anatoliense]|nr:hypothetical protein XNA1_2710008 [Xenorhabdus nematophila str. Anatoliense]